MKVLCNLRKAKAKQDKPVLQEISWVTHMHIYQISYTFILDFDCTYYLFTWIKDT